MVETKIEDSVKYSFVVAEIELFRLCHRLSIQPIDIPPLERTLNHSLIIPCINLQKQHEKVTI
jgi:hypothetical protein